MIQEIENFKGMKVSLNVPLIANYILQGLRQRDIALKCGVTDQAVSSYIKQHYEELLPICDPSDRLLALKSKHVANKALKQIDNILTLESFDKKHLVPLNITAGTQTDKYRLLSDRSTANISIDALKANINDADRDIKEAEARIRQLTGGTEMGNEAEIIDVDGECTS